MRALVTGGSGFIGRHVVRALAERGHDVQLITRAKCSSSIQNVRCVAADLATGFGFGSIDWKDIDSVIHLAAAGVKASDRQWPECVQTNVVGTQRLLTEIQRRSEHKPTVFISDTFYTKALSHCQNLKDNPYIMTKLAAAEIANMWSETYSGPTIVGTFFQIFGPGDHAANVLSYAATNLIAGRKCLLGSGSGMRDWLYITDAVSAILASLETRGSGLHRIDIGSGQMVSVRQMVECLCDLAGAPRSLLSFDPAIDRADLGFSLAAKDLPAGWKPAVALEAGLEMLLSNI